jgi:ArsR family transcriptional regulator
MINSATLRDLSVACCRALSDDTRIRILEALVGKETCVCELVDRLDVAQPLLSHHLKTLREAGLVRAEKRGRWMFYSIDADALEQTAAALSTLASAQRSAGTRLEVCCG